MTALTWDNAGERIFQTGVDRGVLYLLDGSAAAWNGLLSIEDSTQNDVKSYYQDGLKFLDSVTPGEFNGKLKAFTYPDEFERALGIKTYHSGLSYYEQLPERFHLCYRTLIGNELEQMDYGYKIHILYNLVCSQDSATFDSLSDSPNVTEFSWVITGTPIDQAATGGYRPMVHISVDSTKVDPALMSFLEDTLYGTATADPVLPPPLTITDIIGGVGYLYITDNGDGTWTATDPSDEHIVMTDSTTFEIDEVNATYSDPDTYDVSTTIPH